MKAVNKGVQRGYLGQIISLSNRVKQPLQQQDGQIWTHFATGVAETW